MTTTQGITHPHPGDRGTAGCTPALSPRSEKPLSVDQALELGDELLRQLAQVIGDPEALDETFVRWLTVLEDDNFNRVCLASLRTLFHRCLTRVDEVPAGHVAFIERNTA